MSIKSKGFFILAGIIFFTVLANLLIRPVVVYFAQKQLKNVFRGAEVSIGSANPELTRRLSFSNINIVKKRDYDISIKQAVFEYTLVSILQGRINRIFLQELEVKTNDLTVSGLSLNSGQGPVPGELKVSRVKYNKLNITGIKSEARLSGRDLLLNNFYAAVFGGEARGEIKVGIGSLISYEGVLRLSGLDISRAVEDFELKEKFEMTGRLSGALNFKGAGTDLRLLTGKLTSLDPGGTLLIKDEKFLRNLASRTGQSAELLVESFRNYQYTIGVSRVSTDGRDIVLDTELNGQAGKRSLRTVLHELIFQKEEK